MREDKSIEFKQDISSTFLKTVSAYANFDGGTILFGVDDNGSYIGMKDPVGSSLDIENKINDSISPKPDFSISINPNTNVISLNIKEGLDKPYLYKGKAYRRSDSATVEVDKLELRRLTLDGLNLDFEDLPAYEPKSFDEYTFSILEKQLKEKLCIEKISADVLRTFGFYSKEKKLNIAASLLADKNEMPGTDIVRFGKSINEILDRKRSIGVSILQQYSDAVEMFLRYYQYEAIEGFERVKVDTIPESAFREAIANALLHKTWDVNSNIRVAMYSDRVEINSLGGLPKGLTKEEYLNGRVTSLRNPIIANVFLRLGLIEMLGSGIHRIKKAYDSSLLKPQFDISENCISITLPLLTSEPDVSSDGKGVLQLMEDRVKYSSSDLGVSLGWNKYKAIRELNKLTESGYIQKTGTGRATRYEKK